MEGACGEGWVLTFDFIAVFCGVGSCRAGGRFALVLAFDAALVLETALADGFVRSLDADGFGGIPDLAFSFRCSDPVDGLFGAINITC